MVHRKSFASEKKKSSYSEFRFDKFVSFTIDKIKKLAIYQSKLLAEDLGNMTVTFTIGNWALPYLNLLK